MALKDVGARFVVEGEGQFLSSMARGDRALDNMGASASRAGVQMRTGLYVGAAAASALVAGLSYAEQKAREFESAFAGVRKTVDGTEQELQAIKRAFIDMSLAIPVNVNELNRIGEAAGQLGISKQNIVDFTQVAAEMGIATNLSSDQAAEGMARLANIVRLPQEQFRNLGSTIVDLGNHSAATESDILQMALRLAGAGSVIGLTTPQILGMATALSSVGIEAEAGGSAFSRVFVEIASEVKSGGERLALFAAVAGKTTADFKRQFETDANGAIVDFVKGLDKVTESGGNVFGVLKDLELGEGRVRDALVKSAQATDLMEEATQRGTRAWEDNVALTDEANKRYETTESKMILAQSAFDEAARSLGERLQPSQIKVTEAMTGFLNDALIPLVETYGPQLGTFLSNSIDGWGVLARVIRDDNIPTWEKLLGVLIAVNNAMPWNIAGGIAKGIGGSVLGAGFGAGASDEWLNAPSKEATFNAEVARARAQATSDAILEEQNLNYEIVRTTEAIEEQSDATAEGSDELDKFRDRVNAARGALNESSGATKADTEAKKAAAAASEAEAEARRAVAEAARLEAEALRQAKLAREAVVAGVIGTAGRDIAGVASRSPEDAVRNLELGVRVLEDMTTAGQDLAVPLALIDQSLGTLSGKLGTLGGDDLATAGAVMDGLNRLRSELAAGTIGTEEFANGVSQLRGDLTRLVGVVDDAAQVIKEQWEEIAQAEKDSMLRNLEEQKAERINIYKSMTDLYLHNLNTEVEASQEAAKKKIEADREVARQRADTMTRMAAWEEAQERERQARKAARLDPFTVEGIRASLGARGSSAIADILNRFIQQGEDVQGASRVIRNISEVLGLTGSAFGDVTAIQKALDLIFAPGKGFTAQPDKAALPIGAGAGGGSGSSTTFNVVANYTQPQDPQSLRTDLESIAMMSAR